jgi:hypothetical protein
MSGFISAAGVIEQAIDAAASDDFGLDGWRDDGLERSLDAFCRMPPTSEVRDAAATKCIHDLTLQLRIEQWFKAHPEIEDRPIEGPVFVMGLPRTGTTAMVAMLALEDRFRFLRDWEGTRKFGDHRYTAEEYGLTDAAIREAFKDYGERFGLWENAA